MPSPAFITLLPVNRVPNKLAPNVHNNMLRNPSLCSFASLLIVLRTPFIDEPHSLRFS